MIRGENSGHVRRGALNRPHAGFSGRKAVDWDERMRMDLDYVEHWSPALDLVIVARTVKVVLTGRGAY